MVPRKFNIVDFDGFDIVEQYGEALPGIYDKIIDAHWNCVYIMCFGLKFGSLDVAPQYMTPELFSDHIMLNGIISIDRNDVITIPGIEPPPPPPPPLLYGKIHFMVGEVEVYSELVEAGVTVEHTQYYDGAFYYAEAELQEADTYVEMSVIQAKYSIVQLTLVPTTVSKEGNNLRIVSSSGTGIILSSASESSVKARWIRSNNRQVGNCTSSATLPSVVTSGAGRGSFSAPQNNVDFTITNSSQYPNSFIGYVSGVSELLIYNFFN